MSEVAMPLRAAAPPRAGRAAPAAAEGRFRRFLLTATVVALPLQDHLPAIGGFSIMYIAFALLTVVAIFTQPQALVRAASSRIFLAAAAVLAVAFVVEALHRGSDYEICFRLLQMFVGGVVIGSYCVRDPRAGDAVLTGLVLASLWVGVLLIRGTYSVVASSGASDFVHASMLRMVAFSNVRLKANPNELAFLLASAACIAAARAILRRSRTSRLLNGAVVLICSLATFLTFSRSGIAALVLGLGYVLAKVVNRKLFWRVVMIAAAAVLLISMFVPSAVFSRVALFRERDSQGNREARLDIYDRAAQSFGEYAVAGVGAGNYWKWWAVRKGLAESEGKAMGPHNTLLAALMYWGAPALVAMLILLLLTWRAVAAFREAGLTAEWVGTSVFALIMLLVALSSHDFYSKDFSMLFGLAAGYDVVRRRALRPRPRRVAS